MKFKYLQITEKETLDHIEECLVSIRTEEVALFDLAKEFGAKECLQYSGGSVASFTFNYGERPDKSVWKKVKHGFMPKVKTSEHKLLMGVPKSIDYRDIIKKYSFGGEMFIGEMSASGHGFKVHSSYLKGNRKTGFYVIVVPYADEFDREVDSSLVEIKEWEMIKGIDEQSND